jgi:hypothetical protein
MDRRTLGRGDHAAARAATEGLDRWVRSLPWVCGLPAETAGDTGVRYAVDCPPLGASGVWLYIKQAGPGGAPPEVQVVLPEHVAVQAAKGGWGLPAVTPEDGRVVVSVAPPSTDSNVHALQALFVLAYDAVFALRRR